MYASTEVILDFFSPLIPFYNTAVFTNFAFRVNKILQVPLIIFFIFSQFVFKYSDST